ncbi:beta-galactosidase-like [Periplaneta americana]|uniref:beta-galactosidase-like n=1 Tax=Periplaneta americana TaxID=6978 RepID=UPI0037E93D08
MSTMICCSLCFFTLLWLQSDASLFRAEGGRDVFLHDNRSSSVFVAGCLDYFRVPRPYWRRRIRLMRAAGVNALQTSVEWSSHEPSPGQFDFEGDNDVVEFIKTAQKENLLVILRAGPFIGAERDFGGLPSWLLWEYPDIRLRSNDPHYLMRVELYLAQLLPRIRPLLDVNGGPVILVEIVTETTNHQTKLKDLYRRHLGHEVALVVVNTAKSRFNNPARTMGSIFNFFSPSYDWDADTRPLYYSSQSVDISERFQREELEIGWCALWGFAWKLLSTSQFEAMMRHSLLQTTNRTITSLSVFHGGSNFGFGAGAFYVPQTMTYVPYTTSYDCDAPINEAGTVTPKFHMLRELLTKHLPDTPPVPEVETSAQYGDVELLGTACLLESHGLARNVTTNFRALTFEELRQASGLVVYETELREELGDCQLFVPQLRDRAQVYLDRHLVGILSRTVKTFRLDLTHLHKGTLLQIVVENLGRAYPDSWDDAHKHYKGLSFSPDGVLLCGHPVYNWTMYSYPLDSPFFIHNFVDDLPGRQHGWHFCTPTLYKGSFQLPPNVQNPRDTFLNLEEWGKGVVWLNGRNLGRYWSSTGPQFTIYVPGCWLLPTPGVNKLAVLELELQEVRQNVSLQANPVLRAGLVTNEQLLMPERSRWRYLTKKRLTKIPTEIQPNWGSQLENLGGTPSWSTTLVYGLVYPSQGGKHRAEG